jgi:hypothetical protein
VIQILDQKLLPLQPLFTFDARSISALPLEVERLGDDVIEIEITSTEFAGPRKMRIPVLKGIHVY